MKRKMIAVILSLTTTLAMARPMNPVVEEYQDIGRLLKSEPQKAQLAVIVNAMASNQCGRVADLNRLMSSAELKVVETYINDHGSDGTQSYLNTLNNAVSAVCQSSLSLTSYQQKVPKPVPVKVVPAPKVRPAPDPVVPLVAAVVAPVVTSIILGPGRRR